MTLRPLPHAAVSALTTSCRPALSQPRRVIHAAAKSTGEERQCGSITEGLGVLSRSFEERLDGQDRDVVLQFAAGEGEHFAQERLGQVLK